MTRSVKVTRLIEEGVPYVQVDSGPQTAARLANRATLAGAHIDSYFDAILGRWHLCIARPEWTDAWRAWWTINEHHRWQIAGAEFNGPQGITRATIRDLLSALEER